MVHLGRNPISAKGWEEFKNVFIDEDTATGAGQGNCDISFRVIYENANRHLIKFQIVKGVGWLP